MSSSVDHVRFIHSSDWQLGMTRAFLDAEAAARFAQARIDAIVTLGTLAQRNDARFIVVAGDVFESNQLARKTLLRAIDALQAVPVPVFLLPGNHDPLNAASIFATREFANAAEGITVLRDSMPVAVPGLAGVEVVGAPWRSKHPNADLCAELAARLEPARDVIRIAVAHGQVDRLSPDASRPEIIDLANAERAIAQGKFHYLALGDRHSTTEVGDTGRVWYCGTPVATAFDETDPNQALLVEVASRGECSVRPLPIGDWTFIAAHRAMNGERDLAQFREWLDALPGKERSIVKVGFEGSVNLANAAALDELMASRAELFAGLWVRRRHSHLAIVPDQFDEDSVSLAGYARETWNELLGAAAAGDSAAADALRLFYRLSGQAGA